MSQLWFKGFVVVVGLGLCLSTVGCSASRTRAQSRAKVLEAEYVVFCLKKKMMRTQVADAQGRQDEALAELQQAKFEKAEIERLARGRAGQSAQLASRANQAEMQADRAVETASAWKTQADLYKTQASRLQAQLDSAAVRVTPVEPARRDFNAGDAPELAALKSDLQRKMSAAGISMPVEIRTSQDGTRRVAVVIPDAFQSGKATLAYNPTAVKAVVGLGRLVKSSYPESQIRVEGHTDSDPMVKSKPVWGSNENLSRARADYVKKLLTDTGVSSSQVVTSGVGSSHPIEAGSTKRAKSHNRRVEVFIDPR